MIRVRFAPSPTGYLHIGGARTALFNWLFARHNKGKFILRIEDTDKARSKKIFLDQILEDLRWLGLNWDEGPYFQSERSKLYTECAQKLLQEGLAFSEGKAIILKVPQKDFEFTDIIRGSIKFAAGSFKDQVLIKSDGTPTYNFACCCDDHQMQISHVIRGDDHISNTPKQLAIYEALNFNPPQFVHIPLIVAGDRSRLSKRKGAMPVSYYREQGYLPETLFNFLALLGWSLGANREIASRDEIIKQFKLERVLKTAAAFNVEKLDWMNGQYIQSLNTEKLKKLLLPLLLQKKVITQNYDENWLAEVIDLLKPRMKKLSDFISLAEFFFEDKIKYTAEAKEFLREKEKTKEILGKLVGVLDGLESFDLPTVEGACRRLIAQEGIRGADLIHPVRVALTGKRVGPGLFETMAVLGKEKVLDRLNQVVKLIT
ncbi:MAG: glutamate--tRNA ligase [Omnitrophica bacterium]|nr:glutamate--tRNA ligase [Candidatus Omnitrophota bacterium]